MHSAVPTNFPPVLWHPLWILKAKTVRAKFASVAEAPEQNPLKQETESHQTVVLQWRMASEFFVTIMFSD